MTKENMIKLPIVDQATNISGKKVFVRGDIDVPLQADSGQRIAVSDDTRVKDIWPTVEFLLKQNCQVILAGHLGRPEGKIVPELSAAPIAQYLANLTHSTNLKNVDFGFIQGFKISENLTVLENLRFDPREEAND